MTALLVLHSLLALIGDMSYLLYASAGVAALGVGFGLYFVLARGPRRLRGYRRAQRLLHQGSWEAALTTVRRLERIGRPTLLWEGRFHNLEGECERAGGDAALRDQRYEDGLKHYRRAAGLLRLDEAELRTRVLETMLAEVRRLFATGAGSNAAVHALISRILLLHSPCPEASFWQGLCHVRDGRIDLALTALSTAHEASNRKILDPPLYLGTLLLREGRVQEALRHLSEANRLEANCPFVLWQLGLALVAAESDPGLAVRALQRALGARGLELWTREPGRAWVEAFPEGRSFVRRLALKDPYVCPVLGADLTAMIRQGKTALAQAHYRLGSFQEAADLFAKLLQDSPPSAPLLRGLGLALVRLERYDDAFKHLRAALEQENPKSHVTAGYLALCGALGKPTQPEDRPRNVSWAIRLLSRFDGKGDEEWARHCSIILAEARAANLAVAVEDQVRLCDVLASVSATDVTAAAAYDHLAACFPEAVRPEHAWLYCRAAQLHGCASERDLELFEQTFRDEQTARAFFADRQWDFGGVEYTYLDRYTQHRPGGFPDALGPDYPPRCEALLLTRSRRDEEAGHVDAAQSCVEVLLRLNPRNPRAHDRLAYLLNKRGDRQGAIALLAAWQDLEPANPLPLMRKAILQQQAGDTAGRACAIDRALGLTQGPTRAALAFLGARLALADAREAERLLQVCFNEDPDHVDALGYLAAVRATRGDRAGLAALAACMNRPAVENPRFHYLAAVCHLAAEDAEHVLQSGHRVLKLMEAQTPAQHANGQSFDLAVETTFVMGLAHRRLGNAAAAREALQPVADASNSPSAQVARALLGAIHFAGANHDGAISCWTAIDGERRSQWRLDEPFRATVFLSGLLACRKGRFEEAAARFQDADQLGWRDPRLQPLTILALIKAGQQRLYGLDLCNGEQAEANPVAAGQLFEQALAAGCQDPDLAYLLALAYKRQARYAEARAALDRIASPDVPVFIQRGVLALQQGQPAQAEQDFVRALEIDPSDRAAGHNLLLTRLAAGQLAAARALLNQSLSANTPASGEGRFLTQLQHLLTESPLGNGDSHPMPALQEISEEEEKRLLQTLRGLGRPDVALPLLRLLLHARPDSAPVLQAHAEMLLVKGKELADRCLWLEAEALLTPLVRERAVARPTQAALLNLLGCCACLNQDHESGAGYFTAALKLVDRDARLYQNLALAHEWLGDLAQADPHWNRCIDLLDGPMPGPPGQADYGRRLAYDCLSRLVGCYSEKQKWTTALGYAQRALRLRPEDPEALERLFQLYVQAKRPDDARRTLQKMRDLRPEDSQLELHELVLFEVRNLHDIERLLAEIERILGRHPGDPRVEDRTATILIGGVLPQLRFLYDQLTDQMSRVLEHLRRLPTYQIDWSAVDEVLRDLKREYLKLRRLAHRCLALVRSSEHQRAFQELVGKIGRKIDKCQAVAR